MAGDWIKMRTSLLTNPKVNGIARVLESSPQACRALSTGFNGTLSEIVTRTVMRHVTVSSLLVVWGAANEHTKDGVFVNADLSDIDDMVGIPGFGDALVSVGWAVYDEETNCVSLPNFEEYNTSSQVRSAGAKSAAERQKEYRERKKRDANSDVTRDATSDVTSNRREEKRREDISTSLRSVDSAKPRASRKCPGSFVVTDELQAWAQAEHPHVDLVKQTAAFRDHTFKTAHTDWAGTWRNWIRKADQYGQAKASGTSFAPTERPLTPAERRAYESSPHLCDERVHRLMAAERQSRPTPTNVIDMEPSHDHSRLLG